MVRRRLTLKRLDPWSVLKFGAVANVVAYLMGLLVALVVWFIIDRLQLVDQVCEIALDVGFTTCGLEGGTFFRVIALLGAMWAIVATAVLVFLSFLHNLIADLTGGLVLGVVEDGPPARSSASAASGRTEDPSRTGRWEPTPAPGPATPTTQARTRAPGSASGTQAGAQAGGGDGSGPGSGQGSGQGSDGDDLFGSR